MQYTITSMLCRDLYPKPFGDMAVQFDSQADFFLSKRPFSLHSAFESGANIGPDCIVRIEAPEVLS